MSVPESFNPSIRQLTGGWEAKACLPVVGWVAVNARSWQEARMSLWIIQEAVAALRLAAKQSKPPKEWSEEEWRQTLGKMREIWGSR